MNKTFTPGVCYYGVIVEVQCKCPLVYVFHFNIFLQVIVCTAVIFICNVLFNNRVFKVQCLLSYLHRHKTCFCTVVHSTINDTCIFNETFHRHEKQTNHIMPTNAQRQQKEINLLAFNYLKLIYV